MAIFTVVNYYTASIIHSVKAKNEDEALQKARDMKDDIEELKESLQFDESVILE